MSQNANQTNQAKTALQEGKYRVESDSLGQVLVPANRLWGAQTQRSLQHFAMGDLHMPKEVYHAYGYVKKAAAMVNTQMGRLAKEKADLIIRAADEVIRGELDREFPLYVWQSGSGTHTNMNVNEVIANRAIQIIGGTLGTKDPIHPNDHVNMSQSSNDTFPTVMHIATVIAFSTRLIPHVEKLMVAIQEKAAEWIDVVKIGRTHLQDATPLTVGQEWSGYVAQLKQAIVVLKDARQGLYELAAGGTAVGTGLNAPQDFDIHMAEEIAKLTGYPFITAPNKFAVQAGADAIVHASAALRSLAVVLMKIANDIRWLSSGPRAGIHELNLPANEPGSSIMPGKVNPSLSEAMMMICTHVIGNDSAVAFAAAQGNFELNTMRPMMIYHVLHSAKVLGDACEKFQRYCINGITLNRAQIDAYVADSLMLVTILSPVIGYDQAAEIAHLASAKNMTLREAAMASGYITGEQFDKLVVPLKMVGDPQKDFEKT